MPVAVGESRADQRLDQTRRIVKRPPTHGGDLHRRVMRQITVLGECPALAPQADEHADGFVPGDAEVVEEHGELAVPGQGDIHHDEVQRRPLPTAS
jgi:hypothetical protein